MKLLTKQRWRLAVNAEADMATKVVLNQMMNLGGRPSDLTLSEGMKGIPGQPATLLPTEKVMDISRDGILRAHGQLSLHGGTVRTTTASTIPTALGVLALRTREQVRLGEASGTGTLARGVPIQAGGPTPAAPTGSTVNLDGGTPNSSGRAGRVSVLSSLTVMAAMTTLVVERLVDQIPRQPGRLRVVATMWVLTC